MGFMGFGMQKWIYTMRPRKPFSKQRKGSFTVPPTYKRNFKLQHSKKTNSHNIGIIIIIIASLFVIFLIPKWCAYEDFKYQREIAIKSAEDNYAFEFLMTSGKRRLNSGKISDAYSEFKLAYAIKPNNKEVNQSLLETLTILCLDYNYHCDSY